MPEVKERFKFWLKRNWRYVTVSAVFGFLGIYIGWSCGSGGGEPAKESSQSKQSGAAAQATGKKKVIWTCSMHPQIRMPKPGKCPICFMDLIPLEEGDDQGGSPRKLAISEVAKALAELETATVERRPVAVEVRLLGKVAYDETRVKTITAWIGGRIERMFVDYTGVRVRRGDHLVRIYSPELIAAQEELLQSLEAYRRLKRRGVTGEALRVAYKALQSARNKLLLWGLKKWQIERVEKSGKAQTQVNIYSPMGGIVIKKLALEGMYVKEGSPLYKIADLSKVWIVFDAYERDLPWLRVGQTVEFTTLARPGKKFKGEIVYIDPVLNQKTRTVRVRVNADNPDEFLKPGMFVRGTVFVEVDARGEARLPTLRGLWRCPMHPEVVRWRKGFCPICGMALERIRRHRSKNGEKDPLVIPVSAPLITGKRAVVYVKLPKTKRPTYEGREITLGPRAGKFFVVLSGLKEGEEVVVHGAFKLDSELQIRAKPSMMNPEIKAEKGKLPPIGPKWNGVSERFLRALEPLYRTYFELSRALSDDNPKAAQKLFGKLKNLLRSKRLSGWKRVIGWKLFRAKLFDIADKGARLSYLSGLRKYFYKLSLAMIELDRRAGHAGLKPHFVAFCPMAFKGKGAFWLQTEQKIVNPYLGQKMLSCGEIKLKIPGWDEQPVRAPARFVSSLSPLYRTYLKLAEALFKDDFEGAKGALREFIGALKKRRSYHLPKRYKRRWIKLKALLEAAAKEANNASDLSKMRIGFDKLSKGMLQMVFIFGHALKKPLFEAFCPMAFDNRGAAWLQDQDRRVHNPYFGKKMPYCGDIKRRFSSRAVLQSKRGGAK